MDNLELDLGFASYSSSDFEDALPAQARGVVRRCAYHSAALATPRVHTPSCRLPRLQPRRTLLPASTHAAAPALQRPLNLRLDHAGVAALWGASGAAFSAPRAALAALTSTLLLPAAAALPACMPAELREAISAPPCAAASKPSLATHVPRPPKGRPAAANASGKRARGHGRGNDKRPVSRTRRLHSMYARCRPPC